MIVLMPQELALGGVKRDADGTLLRADVLNGAWALEITPTEFVCKDSFDRIRNTLPRSSFVELRVPAPYNKDYNTAIAWARENYREAIFRDKDSLDYAAHGPGFIDA